MRIINKSKKSNIKCEHCDFYSEVDETITKCSNEDSPKYATVVNYWNRCQCFKWRSDINGLQNKD